MATADPGQMVFDETGSRLAFVNPNGIIDVYDFDRCSGLLTGWQSVSWYQGLSSYFGYYGCAFSPGGRFLYVTQVFWGSWYASGQLWQFDLQAANPFNSRVNVYTIPEADSVCFGQLKLGPDGKIYVPYIRSVYDTITENTYNQHLGVVNNPDLPGLACNFNLAQINIAPRKTTSNLPNLPNFRLGPIYFQPANAGPDQERCPDEPPVQLGVPDTSQGRCTFSWSPTAGLDDPSAAMPFADPDTSTTYVLTVTDTSAHSACAVTYDTVQANVKSCKLEIPNIVTPNGDGIADRFWIRNLEAGTQLFIFDRWGNELYQSPDYQNDYEPASLKEGVYYYRLEPPAGSLNKPSAGNFVLMR